MSNACSKLPSICQCNLLQWRHYPGSAVRHLLQRRRLAVHGGGLNAEVAVCCRASCTTNTTQIRQKKSLQATHMRSLSRPLSFLKSQVNISRNSSLEVRGSFSRNQVFSSRPKITEGLGRSFFFPESQRLLHRLPLSKYPLTIPNARLLGSSDLTMETCVRRFCRSCSTSMQSFCDKRQ